MRVFLFVLSVVAFLAGLAIMAGAHGAIHQIGGLILFLIAAVLLSGAAIVEAVNKAGIAATAVDPAYFYATEAGPDGPHSLAAMRGLRRCGALAADTQVLQQGAQAWHPAADVFPDLFPGA